MPGIISGLNYDLIASVMSSFKDEDNRKKKLRYKENLEVCSDDILSEKTNKKVGYIKADQLHYFNESTIEYYVLAQLESELLDELVNLIIELNNDGVLKINLFNLKDNNL